MTDYEWLEQRDELIKTLKAIGIDKDSWVQIWEDAQESGEK